MRAQSGKLANRVVAFSLARKARYFRQYLSSGEATDKGVTDNLLLSNDFTSMALTVTSTQKTRYILYLIVRLELELELFLAYRFVCIRRTRQLLMQR